MLFLHSLQAEQVSESSIMLPRTHIATLLPLQKGFIVISSFIFTLLSDKLQVMLLGELKLKRVSNM